MNQTTKRTAGLHRAGRDIQNGTAFAGAPHQKPNRARKSGAGCGFGQTTQGLRATKPHLAVQDARRHFTHANKLRCAAGQHHARAAFLAKPA